MVNVILQEDVASLDEVVVVAYGTSTKESITGSVGVVRSEELEQVPVSTFEQTLRGSTAGLQASAVDGAPGGNTQVRIRGIGSISASSEPLYVIDGIPVQNGSIGTIDNGGSSTNVMASINPNDIASISVLKDAASTAIYGSRGANGVILITTKSGSSGKAKITLKTLTGFNSQAYNNILKPLNAAEYTELFLEGYVNLGDTPEEAQERFDATFQQLIDPSTGEPTDTNWLDAITRTGITQSYDLSASGGTENLKYFFSGAYYDQENYIIGSGFNRLSARSNIEFKATDYLTVSNNISVSNSTTNTFFDGGSFNNPFKNSLELSPLIPIYDEEGRFNGEHADYFPLGGANPVGSLSGDDLWENKQFRVIDNFAVSIKPVKNLTLRSQLNFDLLTLTESQYQNP
ncbi:MAG TPA: SusC/RagA family TonB-linked outer membrane protein, partial [Maribacter sp.]|nr:SusC/RagA family TonB-linked outer membrane protein [Maribacter sp.]